MTDECPQCGTATYGNSFRAAVELGSGDTLDGALCGNCGVVFVPDPGETYAEHYGIKPEDDE